MINNSDWTLGEYKANSKPIIIVQRSAFGVLRLSQEKANLKKQSQFIRIAYCVMRIAKRNLKKQACPERSRMEPIYFVLSTA